MKNHDYKKSSLILILFYELYFENKELRVSDLYKRFGCCKATIYNLISDIDIFIGEYYLYNIDIVVKRGLVKIIKK